MITTEENPPSKKGEKDEINKPLTDEEALDIQIKYLNSSTKNILSSIMQDEPDPMANLPETELNNKNIDKGIYLYLQNVHNKHYCNEINFILNSINSKISYINEKNKDFFQNKKFLEREINTISVERMDYFNEKETLDKDLEILTLNTMQNSFACKTDRCDTSLNVSLSNFNNSEFDDIEIAQKTKKLEKLKKKYNELFDKVSVHKKEYPILKNKSNIIQGDNMVLNEKLKQKQLIWEQIRRENERFKTIIIKKDYAHIDSIKKKEKKQDKNEKQGQNKNIKVAKIGSFLSSMFGKKK
jgi:hypothetical protein